MAKVLEREPIGSPVSVIDPDPDPINKGETLDREELTNKLPKPSSKMYFDGPAFYSYLGSISLEDWNNRVIMYMYRIFPRINRAVNEKYIACVTNPIDEDWILKTHGSGDYLFIVNDANSSGGKKGYATICKAQLKISNPDYDPILNLSELDVHYPGNRTYVERLIALGKLTPDAKPVSNTPVAPLTNNTDPALVQLLGRLIDRIDRKDIRNTSDPTDTAINKAFEVMARGNQAATEMMLSQMKQDDPEKLFKLVGIIQAMVKQPEPVKQDDSIWKMLLQTQADGFKNQMLLMEKMIEMNKAKPEEDEDTKMDKWLERMSKLMEFTGARGGGKKGTLETVMEYGGPVLMQVFGLINNMMAMKARGDASKPGAVVDPNGPPVMTGTEINGGTPPGLTEATPNKGVGDAMNMNMEEQRNQVLSALKQAGPMVVAAINRGDPGDKFAEAIDTMYGPESGLYNQLAAQGEEGLINVLKMDAGLWERLKLVEPKVRQFIREFIDYGKPEPGPVQPEVLQENI